MDFRISIANTIKRYKKKIPIDNRKNNQSYFFVNYMLKEPERNNHLIEREEFETFINLLNNDFGDGYNEIINEFLEYDYDEGANEKKDNVDNETSNSEYSDNSEEYSENRDNKDSEEYFSFSEDRIYEVQGNNLSEKYISDERKDVIKANEIESSINNKVTSQLGKTKPSKRK